ncbi:Bro25 [Heliothis virescens ascovirus 3f]|uniref:Bro25 n=1 Tax=Heliothis virescens ascovirus 3f TaxID=328614 RepID=A0A171PVQ8_9VIRU|nr:Bro25 [Heliothis virescens ascovirus 3f]AJP09132.1 Bro25 [Heliothis virescens ascovirus 3f]
MVANPFAEALQYSRANKAIFDKVSIGNQKNYEDIKSPEVTKTVTSLPRNIQAKTKFINNGGVIELLMNSQMEYARQFRYWLSSVKLNIDSETDAIAEFNEWRANPSNMVLLQSMVDQTCKGDGVVYVVTNRLLQMIDAFKIGFTFDLDARISELNVASPLDFKAVFVRETANPRELEQKLHRHFHESRIKREFFKLTAEDLALLPLICDNLPAQ